MNRRALLGTVASLGTTALAGCSGLQGPRAISDPAISHEEGEVVMGFGESGDQIARSTIMYDGNPPGSEMVASLKFRMWHRGGTTVESLRLGLRGPPSGPKPPASVFVAVPDNARFPEVALYSAPDSSARVIEIEDLGTLGRGTFGLDCFVVPYVDQRPLPLRLSIDSRVTTAGILGGEYYLDGSTDIEIPMA